MEKKNTETGKKDKSNGLMIKIATFIVDRRNLFFCCLR